MFLHRLLESVGWRGGPPAITPSPLGLDSLMLWEGVKEPLAVKRDLAFKIDLCSFSRPSGCPPLMTDPDAVWLFLYSEGGQQEKTQRGLR